MRDKKTGIKSVLLIVFVWLFALALAYLVIMKITFILGS
jgi:hypothetical protein